MARRLFFLLGILFCLAGFSWHYILPPPDISAPAFQMIESTRTADFRHHRETLVQLVQTHCGTGAAAEVIAAIDPLTRESAQWDPSGQFSPPAISRFWTSFAAIQKRQQEEQFSLIMATLTTGCVLLLLSIAASFRTLSMWEKLAHSFLPPTVPPRLNPLNDFETFYNELVEQKERALERAVALTFSLQRERLENKRLQSEIAARFKSTEEADNPFTSTMSHRSGSTPGLAPQVTPAPQNPPTPLEPLAPALSPSGPTGGAMGFPPEVMPGINQDFRPDMARDTSVSSTIPAPSHSGFGMPTPGAIQSGSIPGAIQDDIPRPSPSSRQSASSIGRLLSEKPVSSVSELLPYVPRFEDFTSLEQLRQRKGGVVVEIRPSLDGLLMMAQTYGAGSISKYYTSLITFLDRCFIAFPSDLAQEKYSIYWHSRVSDLREDELLSTIQAEMPHLQWVGDEGVISQIQLDVILHRTPG